MKAQLVIKGAIYKCGDELLRAQFTGEFYMVDCTEYKTVKQIRQECSKETAKRFIKEGYHLTYDGVKYFECEYGHFNTDEFELLSDLSGIDFYDEETDFN